MPKVAMTVLLPVYNGAAYIRAAIDSILAQTDQDFELLIINDASTDASAAMISSYNDARIRLITNPKNLGLIGTLNLGLQEAKGEYIARMDQDDIAAPDRLWIQRQYLEQHPDCAVVASTVTLMDQTGRPTGEWLDDVRHVSAQEINHYLPIANCIAHPTIMGRTDILKHYRYNPTQANAEDYDLWLRLAADDRRIEKIAQPLLHYRMHTASMTQQSQQRTGPGKNVLVKGRWLRHQFGRGRVNHFFWRVTWQYGKEIMLWLATSLGLAWYRLAKKIIRAVGFSIGYSISRWYRLTSPAGYFFFFHSYGVGGAEIVHSQIVATVADKTPLIMFTQPTLTTTTWLEAYRQSGRVLDLAKPLSSVVGCSLYLGIMAHAINRQPGAVVFGSISPFFYELLPHLGPQVRTIDLTHALDGSSEHITTQCVPYLQHRIVINQAIYRQLLDLYAAYRLPAHYQQRLTVIENGVTIPTTNPPRAATPWQIIYLGRGTYEKRVHLIGQIAQRCRQADLPVQFTLVGHIPAALKNQYSAVCTFKPEMVAADAKEKLFNSAHLLIMTSSREGFPLSVMEAMAHGVVPLVTNVGGIPDHIQHQVTGLLVDNTHEAAIIEAMVQLIQYYSQHPSDWQRLSNQAYHYAAQHFALTACQQHYRQLWQTLT